MPVCKLSTGALIITLRNASEGWLGSSCEERAASPQVVAFWGLAALDPSHPLSMIALTVNREVMINARGVSPGSKRFVSEIDD